MKSAEIQQILINLIHQVDGPAPAVLTPGQIISVLLKEVQGNAAVLTYLGQDIPARLELEIPQGTRLNCRVEQDNDGEVILKVIDGNRQAISPQDLKSIAAGLGLKDDMFSLGVIREMVRYQMPLTAETARRLSTFTNSNGLPEEDIWVPVHILRQGVPLTKQNYENVKAMITDKNYLRADIEKLSGLVQNLINSSQPGENIHRLAGAVKQALDSFHLHSNDSVDSMAVKITQAFRNLAPVFNQPESVGNGEKAQVLSAVVGRSLDTAKGEIVNKIVNRILELVENNETLKASTDKLQLINRVFSSLIQKQDEPVLKNELQAKLKQLVILLSDHSSPETKKILQASGNVLDKLEFIQNAGRSEPNRDQTVIVYSTVHYENKEEPLRLAVSYRDNRKDSNSDLARCHVEVRLQTPKLGIVRCEVGVEHRKLSVKFFVDNIQARGIIEKYQQHLVRQLENMNYQVQMLGCQIVTAETDRLFEGRQCMPELFTVNLQV